MRLMIVVSLIAVIVVCSVLLAGCARPTQVQPLDCAGQWVAVTKGGHVVGVVYFGDDCASGKY